jgi:hypothetical protein
MWLEILGLVEKKTEHLTESYLGSFVTSKHKVDSRSRLLSPFSYHLSISIYAGMYSRRLRLNHFFREKGV